MSGQRRGPLASLLRGVTALAEPIYSGVVSHRNRRFDRGVKVRSLPRPVISVGNITAGGTGKTPVVRWLCESLRHAGRRPAVLLRGYKSAAGVSDEQRMLEQSLRGDPPIVVRANPNRFEGGAAVLADRPDVDCFVLDDGFQHRKLARDVDLVLIDATRPFGFGHVHPRGLLREPLKGLARAAALLITRSDEIPPAALDELEQQLRRYSTAPIYHSTHAHAGFRPATSDASHPPDHPTSDLAGRRVFAFCGIGNPDSFLRQVEHFAGPLAGSRRFGDHHAYTEPDVRDLTAAAQQARADVMVTTEKDWAKLSAMPSASNAQIPIWRAELAIEFRDNDGARLLQQITSTIEQSRARPVATQG